MSRLKHLWSPQPTLVLESVLENTIPDDFIALPKQYRCMNVGSLCVWKFLNIYLKMLFKQGAHASGSAIGQTLHQRKPHLCTMVPTDVPEPGLTQSVLHPRKDVFVLKVCNLTSVAQRFFTLWTLGEEMPGSVPSRTNLGK